MRIIAIAAALLCCGAASASGLEWPGYGDWSAELRAGVNIGGASPLPLPQEIRHIDSYDPHLNLSIEGLAMRRITPLWGVATGIRIETKGMKTGATVRDYGMEIIQDGSRVAGRWTGKVSTTYRSSFITLPVLAVMELNPRWRISAGPYMALALNKTFDGYVHDGYLREGDPTGDKVSFEGDAEAPYDFSSHLRTFQWGLQAGGSWLATNHLEVNASLTWGLNGVMESSFHTVRFGLYPIYLNIGFGYCFGK